MRRSPPSLKRLDKISGHESCGGRLLDENQVSGLARSWFAGGDAGGGGGEARGRILKPVSAGDISLKV